MFWFDTPFTVVKGHSLTQLVVVVTRTEQRDREVFFFHRIITAIITKSLSLSFPRMVFDVLVWLPF